MSECLNVQNVVDYLSNMEKVGKQDVIVVERFQSRKEMPEMPKTYSYRFEIQVCIQVTGMGPDKEEARINVCDLLSSGEYDERLHDAGAYVSEGDDEQFVEEW